MMAPPLVVVLSDADRLGTNRAVAKFAEFVGLEAISRTTDQLESPVEIKGRDRIVAIDAFLLSRAGHEPWFDELLANAQFALVYGFDDRANGWSELENFTGGRVGGVSSIRMAQKATIHADVTHNQFPVSGRSFNLTNGARTVFTLGRNDSGECERYITFDGLAYFVSFRRGESAVFLLAEQAIPDLDANLDPSNDSLRGWYAQLIALSIFFRSAAGPWCWTSPVTPANFIIDDPFLRPRYGHLVYAELLEELEKAGGALTVAFIPYNYRRSNTATVRLVQQHRRHFSIAVHGCDHTGGEYGSTDAEWILGVTGLALERMERHAATTGLGFDNVMVFPQGRFSTVAIAALQANGFDAAANSGAWPIDYGSNPLTARDALSVAVTRYSGFPIFVRRYPTDLFDYAFDALFQKPVLGVEHQNFFAVGLRPLIDTVLAINSLEPKIRWMPLGEATASSCSMRQIGPADFIVRHWTNRFRFQNESGHPMNLLVENPNTEQNVICITMNGSEIPFTQSAGLLRYRFTLQASAAAEIRIDRRRTKRSVQKHALGYRVKVATRRGLSDLRDNYLSRSQRLLAMAEEAKRIIFSRK